jgi:hypothetical protein
MRFWFYSKLHELAWWASYRRIDWLWKIIYRYACPYPTSPRHYSARGCFKTGDCSCENERRFH